MGWTGVRGVSPGQLSVLRWAFAVLMQERRRELNRFTGQPCNSHYVTDVKFSTGNNKKVTDLRERGFKDRMIEKDYY